MGLFDVDFKYLSEALSPVKYRTGSFTGWLYSLLKPIEWVHNSIFKGTKDGLFQRSKWSNVTAFTVGQLTQYGESIYYCDVSNTNKIPNTSPQYWSLYVPDRLGVNERIRITGQKRILEYELNRRFKTFTVTFPQNPLIPDIYIQNTPTLPLFVIGLEQSSGIFTAGQHDGIFKDPLLLSNNFTVYVPTTKYTEYGEKAIRQEVDKYLTAGLNYNVVTY